MTPEELHAFHVDCFHRRRVPMPARVARAFTVAVELARASGVTFAPGQVQVWTYRGPEEEPSVTFYADVPVPVYLNIAPPRTAREWVRLICHELAHAYFDARDYPGFFESEDRAEAFAQRAIKGWR